MENTQTVNSPPRKTNQPSLLEKVIACLPIPVIGEKCSMKMQRHHSETVFPEGEEHMITTTIAARAVVYLYSGALATLIYNGINNLINY